MGNKSITFFSYEFPPLLCGGSSFAKGLAEGLSQAGFKITVIAPDNEGAKSYDAKSLFKVIRFPFSKNTFLNYIIGLVCAAPSLIKHRDSLVFATDILSQRIVSFILPFLHKRLLILAHGSEIFVNFNEKSFLKRWLYTRIYFHALHIIANSNYTKSLLLKQGIDSKRITVVYPAIDQNRFSQNGNPSRIRSLFQLEGKKVILTVGTLSERKGQDAVISALPLVLREIPELRYLIVGSGRFGRQLKKLTTELGLNDHVIFANGVSSEEIIDYYDAADIFVLPNRVVGNFVEGFGIVFLEAASRGRPSIGSDNGGVREAVIHGETGYLIDPLNRAEMAQVITKLLKDRELAARLGKQAKTRALGSFNWGVSCNRLGELLGQIG